MFTYQTQPRSLQLTGSIPAFPQTVELRLRLEPACVFGEGDGDFPLVISSEQFAVNADMNVGRFGIRRHVPLPLINVALKALGGSITLNGGLLTFEYVSPSLQEAGERLEALRLLIPAIVSLYAPTAVTAAVATARIGVHEHYLLLKQVDFNLDVTTVDDYCERLKKGLENMSPLSQTSSAALMMSMHYAHIAMRLADAGRSPWEFAGEVVLNCAKAIEALFGSDRDDIRKGLYQLKIPLEEIEGIFIPLMLLRNEWDVGHAKATPIPSTHFVAVYEFVHELPTATRDLLKVAVSMMAEKKWAPRELAMNTSTTDETKFRKLTRSMNGGLKFRRDRANNPQTSVSGSKSKP